MTQNNETTAADAAVDAALEQAVKRGRQQPSKPAPEPASEAPADDVDPARAKKILRAIGNLDDGDLAWLGRRISAAAEREKHRKIRRPERHGGRPDPVEY